MHPLCPWLSRASAGDARQGRRTRGEEKPLPAFSAPSAQPLGPSQLGLGQPHCLSSLHSLSLPRARGCRSVVLAWLRWLAGGNSEPGTLRTPSSTSWVGPGRWPGTFSRAGATWAAETRPAKSSNSGRVPGEASPASGLLLDWTGHQVPIWYLLSPAPGLPTCLSKWHRVTVKILNWLIVLCLHHKMTFFLG